MPGYLRPKVELEQYVTDSHIVAELVWLSYMRREFVEGRVLDLGCGTGRFSIAAALLGASQVVCLDIDKDAISQVWSMVRNDPYLSSVIDVVVSDALLPCLRSVFHVVFQNPPFGIQSRRGIDIEFLKSACKLGKIVYSIHKAETYEYVINKCRELGDVSVLGFDILNIPPMYKHHFKRLHKVRVVLVRVESRLI